VALSTTTLAHCDAVWGGRQPLHLETPGSTRFRDNEVRLKLHALAYTLATFLRCIELPEAAVTGRWCLPSSPQPDDCERRRHVVNRDPNSI
jgi:hypothetical protein